MCNVAIARYAVVRLTASNAGATQPSSDIPLVRAAVRRARVFDATVAIESEFPVGAGLGGSSAASAALLGALAVWNHTVWDRAQIAEEGRLIEVEDLGIAGGRQDHYAATHGGALALTFTSSVSVRRIAMSTATRDALVARSILVYTGESRISGDTITAVLGAYERGVASVVNALRRMRELAMEMADALGRSDLHALGGILNEHWTHQRALHPSIPTPKIDEVVAKSLSAGALGAKAMGASGGGCVLIIAAPDSVDRIRSAVRPLGEILDFSVDEAGMKIVSQAP